MSCAVKAARFMILLKLLSLIILTYIHGKEEFCHFNKIVLAVAGKIYFVKSLKNPFFSDKNFMEKFIT